MRVQVTLIVFLTLLAASSCTIEKRLYSRGFHIESRKHLRSCSSAVAGDTIRFTDMPPAKTGEEVLSDSLRVASATDTDNASSISIKAVTKPILPIQSSSNTPYKSQFMDKTSKVVQTVSTRTKLTTSRISRSVNRVKENHSSSGREIDWGEVAGWALVIALILGLVILAVTNSAATQIIAIIVGILGIIGIVWLLVIVGRAISNFKFEWFWSGR